MNDDTSGKFWGFYRAVTHKDFNVIFQLYFIIMNVDVRTYLSRIHKKREYVNQVSTYIDTLMKVALQLVWCIEI